MAHGKSLELAKIPKRTSEYLVTHEIKDRRRGGKAVPTPANRAERRAAARGKAWYGNPLGQRMVVHNAQSGVASAGRGGL